MKKEKIFGKIILICVLAASLLAGCSSNRTVDYNPMDSQDGEGTPGGSPGSHAPGNSPQNPDNSATEQKSWKNEFPVKRSDGIQITVALDVKTMVDKEMLLSVVEVQEEVFDAAYKERIAKAIFGESPVYYHGNLEDQGAENRKYVTKFQVEDAIDRTEKWLNWLSSQDSASAAEDYSYAKKKMTSLQSILANAAAEPVPAADYEGNSFMGYVGELPFVLDFEEWEDPASGYRRIVHFFSARVTDVAPQTLRDKARIENQMGDTRMVLGTPGYWRYAQKNLGEAIGAADNEAAISPEEAKKKADAFLAVLGLENVVYQGTLAEKWKGCMDVGKEEKTCYDGYTICYSVGEGKVGFEEYGSALDYRPLLSSDHKCKFAYSDLGIRILVTDEGVVECVINNPVSVLSRTENVMVLPEESVRDIMVKEIRERPDAIFKNLTGRKAHYGVLDLGYFRVHSPQSQGIYSYIPVWRLQKDEKDLGSPILINAMDGSFIDWREEF